MNNGLIYTVGIPWKSVEFCVGLVKNVVIIDKMNSCLSLCVQLTLTPAQQQLLIQQAQAQLLAAAVQHSAGQQSSTTGASISASAATPITLSQPIQITPVRETLSFTPKRGLLYLKL